MKLYDNQTKSYGFVNINANLQMLTKISADIDIHDAVCGNWSSKGSNDDFLGPDGWMETMSQNLRVERKNKGNNRGMCWRD